MTTPTPAAGEPVHEPPPAKPSGRWVLVILGVLAVVATLVIVLATQSDDEPEATSERADTAEAADMSPIQEAANECGNVTGEVADEGRTILIDTGGSTELAEESDTIEGVACILTALEVPQSVIARMDSTRALDGMQDGSWDGFEASWTYHPDDGMNLIITQVD